MRFDLLKAPLSIVAIVAIIIFFQNCSPMNVTNSSKISSEDLSNTLIVAFGDSLTRGANPKNPANTGIKGYVPFLEAKFPNTHFLNCGIGGQTTSDAKRRYIEVLDGDYTNCTQDTVDTINTAAFYNYDSYNGQRPNQILLWLGTNDVLKNTPQQRESIANLRYFLQEAKKRKIKVTMSNLPPYGNVVGFASMTTDRNGAILNRIKTFNNLIEQVASELEITVIDTHSLFKNNFQQYTWDQIHLNSHAYLLVSALWENALRYNNGKPLFNDTTCSVATGHRISSGVAVCSCASGNQGTVYMCVNGEPQEVFKLNQSCVFATDNHEFISHHCTSS